MLFSDVPGSTVSRRWSSVSILYSNVFRFRALSKDNQFRISLGVGYMGADSIPVIVSQKTGFAFADVWQQLKVPLREPSTDGQLYIYARISDVQWGNRGPVQFQLQEGDSMIYDSGANAIEVLKAEQVVGEVHSSHAPAALLAPAGTMVVIPENLRRRGGFIQNLLTNPIFVYFSDVPPAALDRQTARVARSSRIEIPPNYTGKIHVDVKGQFTPDASLVAMVQSLAAVDLA
jgi:hypothetical protein